MGAAVKQLFVEAHGNLELKQYYVLFFSRVAARNRMALFTKQNELFRRL